MNVVAPWLRTDGSSVWTLHRWVLAAVVLPIGMQSGMPGEAPMSMLVVATVCAGLLAMGLATRVAALGVVSVLLAGFVGGEAVPVPLLGFALGLGLMARGGGAFSIDRAIVRQWSSLPLEQEITSDGLIVGRRVGEYGI
jgi:hypothetical protein